MRCVDELTIEVVRKRLVLVGHDTILVLERTGNTAERQCFDMFGARRLRQEVAYAILQGTN